MENNAFDLVSFVSCLSEEKFILILSNEQQLLCYEGKLQCRHYRISTAKKGMGEMLGSECTPRGWHRIYSIIGKNYPMNSVFVGRKWTEEYYSDELAAHSPERDWILTRILQLDGLEPGKNQGGDVDSLKRYIYIHGTPDSTQLGIPGSHGCVRMNNLDIIELADWVNVGVQVYII